MATEGGMTWVGWFLLSGFCLLLTLVVVDTVSGLHARRSLARAARVRSCCHAAGRECRGWDHEPQA